MPDPLSSDNPQQLFDFLWATKYAHRQSEEAKREGEWMAESFIDASYTVAGEELRLMTPRDLCVLDGFESPFVTYRRVPDINDCCFIIWHLNTKNTGRGVMNAFRRGRCYGRLMKQSRDLAFTVAEIEAYCERAFVGLPKEAKPAEGESVALNQRAATVHFMAPLMVDVAGVIGPIDPASGRILADIPIARLMQYKKTIARDNRGEGEAESDLEKRRSDCLQEVHEILSARRAAV